MFTYYCSFLFSLRLNGCRVRVDTFTCFRFDSISSAGQRVDMLHGISLKIPRIFPSLISNPGPIISAHRPNQLFFFFGHLWLLHRPNKVQRSIIIIIIQYCIVIMNQRPCQRTFVKLLQKKINLKLICSFVCWHDSMLTRFENKRFRRHNNNETTFS